MRPSQPPRSTRPFVAACLIFIGGLVVALGGLLVAMGVVACGLGGCVSGHVPGLPVVAEGIVLILIGRWIFRSGRRRYQAAEVDAEAGGTEKNLGSVGEGALSPVRSQPELARAIRALIDGGREPSLQEIRALQDRLSRNLASEVPHFIGHWFADADIRQRDPEYRRVQALELEVALRQMEQQPSA